MLFLFSFIKVLFSPTHRTFDYLLTLITPLSPLGCMLVSGFLVKSDLETEKDSEKIELYNQCQRSEHWLYSSLLLSYRQLPSFVISRFGGASEKLFSLF